MKKLCEFLKERVIEIINFKKKKIKLLRKEQQELCENAKFCYIYKEKFENKYLKNNKYHCRNDSLAVTSFYTT